MVSAPGAEKPETKNCLLTPEPPSAEVYAVHVTFESEMSVPVMMDTFWALVRVETKAAAFW